MSAPAGLRIFGFPLHVRPGFALLLVLVIVVNSGPIGLWLAAGITGFTVLHELGHAFAARATGARAEISLDFLAGYASFQPTRTLKPWERAGISFAGPAIQVVAGVALLLAMGVNPLDRHDVTDSDAALALWWAGPMIGLFNLVPVLPLDGGNIVAAALDKVIPGRARTVMLYASIAATAAGAVALYLNADARPLATFLVFPLLMQMQMLSSTRPSDARKSARRDQATAAAEAEGWRDDGAAPPPGITLSPWLNAHRALRSGDAEQARRMLVEGFSDRRPQGWWPPDSAPKQALTDLVDLLPQPLPTGNHHAELVLANILLALGRFDVAAHYAADSHSRTPSAGSALAVARCAAALGEHGLAMQWLEVAAATSAHPMWLAQAIDSAAEFAGMRSSASLRRLRDDLVSAA